METQQPIRRFQAGQVSCALFENAIQVNGETRQIVKATLGRRYKDRYGNWKTSQSYSRNEIPLAIFVLQKSFEAMLEKSPKSRSTVRLRRSGWNDLAPPIPSTTHADRNPCRSLRGCGRPSRRGRRV